MYNAIFDLPEQMEKALKIATKWKINPDEFIDIKNIVVIGMGGSAIGGDLVRSYLESKIQIPFQVVRHYRLPEYVDDETLVIVSSYSGNTEETLAAVDDAIDRSAMIAAISTGGILKEVAAINEFPMAVIPEGLQPRAAIGYSFVPLLVFFEKIGLIKNAEEEVQTAINHIKNSRELFIEDVPLDNNLAKSLAYKITEMMPIIYTGPTITDAVGLRWKGQICENGKNMAFCSHYPEFNHNELVGWADAITRHKECLLVIQFRDPDDHPQISKRMDIVRDIISGFDIEVVEVLANGPTVLSRMFYLIQMGDYVSYYLAVLNQADPTPVDVIQDLKKKLSKKKK